ncbi:MAG TPA: hypothetical protein VJ253_03165 [Dehalococcoidia bacterium]|nr:hypothetical protein [Dehalococcoidia bacterium]
MAKESGLGVTTFSWDDSAGTVRALVNDFTQFGFDTPRALQDITGLDKSAMERLSLLADFTISGTTVFNDAANAEHDVFKSLATARTVTIVHSAQTLANEVLISSAALTRAQSGELTRAISASLQSGTVPAWT